MTKQKCMCKEHLISPDRQEQDFYSTDPIAIDLLFAEENFSNNIWEKGWTGPTELGWINAN